MAFFELMDAESEETVWKRYDKTLEVAKKDIDDLKAWLHSQPHLPHTLTDSQFKNFLIMNKGIVDKCKPKIDRYYSMRSKFPEMFLDSQPFSARMLGASKYVYHIVLPKLCPDLSRILIIKPKENSEAADIFACFCHLLNLIDYRILEDFSDGTTVILDMEHARMGYFMKLTPMFLKTANYINEKIISSRLIATHIINASSFMDQVLSLAKTIVKPKMMNRVMVHKDMNSMLATLPKDILPKDYGGNEKSLDELEELLLKKFEEHKEFFDQRDQVKVNEELRPPTNENDDFFGYYGSFKKLEVD